MKLTNQILGIGLAAVVGFACSTMADDSAVGSSKKSLEQRIAELEAKLKDAGVGGGVKGSGIKISGYVDTSYVVNLANWNNTGPVAGSSNRNTGRVFDNQADAFNVNAFKLTIQKDKDSGKFPAGFRTDLIYGNDANVLNGASIPNGAAGFNESALFVEQAYVNLGVPIGNGIDVKLGKMVSLMGYEVIESPANWQFSRSDGFRLAPNTQLGVTFGYQWNDTVTTTVGLVNGLNSTARSAGGDAVASSTALPAGGAGNFNRSLDFVGRVDVNGPKTSWGDFSAFGAGFYGHDDATTAATATSATGLSSSNDQEIHIWEIGGLWDKPFGVKPLGLGIDYLYRNDQVSALGAAGGVGSASLDASALSAYGKWDWNKWLTTSGRFSYSWYTNPEAPVAAGGGATGSLGPLIVPAGGFQPSKTDNFSFTLTQAFNVWKDTLVRLEWRKDWTTAGSRSVGFGTPSGAAATGSDIRQSQDTIAVNVVYSF